MQKHEHKKHRLPVECYASAESIYFFTICADRGQPFTNPGLAEAVVQSLQWRASQKKWRLYAYCLMPDHLHFLAQFNSTGDEYVNAGARGIVPKSILDEVCDFKRYTTTQIWMTHYGHGHLWQRSSYDRIVRHTESIGNVISYILGNPVKKGLVDDWQDYPYSGVVHDI